MTSAVCLGLGMLYGVLEAALVDGWGSRGQNQPAVCLGQLERWSLAEAQTRLACWVLSPGKAATLFD